MNTDVEPKLPDVAGAIEETAKAIGWSWTKVAYAAGVGEGAIRKLRTGETKMLGGDALLRLMTGMPGLAERLGFAVLKDAA